MMEKPKLIIPRETYDKIVNWCRLAKNREISGLGVCSYDSKTNTFEVMNAEVIKQTEQGSTTTEMCDQAIGKYLYEQRDTKYQLIWWWHSHVDMGVFWSGTDDACIESFAAKGGVIATVFNKRGEMRTAVKLKAPTIFGDSRIWHDDCKTELITYYPTVLWDQWEAEYKAAEKAYVAPVATHYPSAEDYKTSERWKNRDAFDGFKPGGASWSQPPKKEAKHWPEMEGFIYQTKRGDCWTWSKFVKDWRKAWPYDFENLELVPYVKNKNGKHRQIKLGEATEGEIIDASIHNLPENQKSEADLIDDEDAAKQQALFLEEQEDARLYFCLSEDDWDNLTDDERLKLTNDYCKYLDIPIWEGWSDDVPGQRD